MELWKNTGNLLKKSGILAVQNIFARGQHEQKTACGIASGYDGCEETSSDFV